MKYFCLNFIAATLLVTTGLKGQNDGSNTFYKHFTGMLDTNMFIALDLQGVADNLTGQYNYYFKVEGSNNEFFYGKTIPVSGKIKDKTLTFNDYNSEGSGFTCRFEGDNQLTGTWQGGRPAKEIPFSLKEDYSKGSMPLASYHLNRTHYLLEGEEFISISPTAKIRIKMLYPAHAFNRELKDTLDAVITSFMINVNEPVKSPKLLMENIVYDFFDSYREATEGIDDLTNIASFNWQKELDMEVLCNQNNILSVRFSKYAYTGGAHGISIMQHEVFDLAKNRVLSLDDLFTEKTHAQIAGILDKKLRKLNGIQPHESLRDAGFLVDSIGPNNNFYVNTSGIGFFYNTYEIAPYASGTTEIFLPFREIGHLLKNREIFEWTKPE